MASATVAAAVMVFAGPRDRYQSALALREHQALEALVTDAYFGSFWVGNKWLGKGVHRFMSGRHHPQLPARQVITSLPALYHAARAKRARRKDSPHYASSDECLSGLAGEVALARGTPLVAYSYYAHAAFQKMHGSRLPRILFQVHPHGDFLRDLYLAEMEKIPEARDSLQEEVEMSPLFSHNDRTHEMADGIICASEFTRRSLISVGAKAKILVTGYGVSLELFTERMTPPKNKCLTIGFIGALSQRKGARYLLAAMNRMPRGAVKLVIYTRTTPDAALMRGYEHLSIEVRSGLSDNDLALDMKGCDLIALPSIAEGFGLVILEAMACGIPVLCTNHTGGADIIEHQHDGFVVNAGSAEAIHEVLDWAVTRTATLFAMGRAARRKVEQHDWQTYRRKFFMAYSQLIVQANASDHE